MAWWSAFGAVFRVVKMGSVPGSTQKGQERRGAGVVPVPFPGCIISTPVIFVSVKPVFGLSRVLTNLARDKLYGLYLY